MTVTTQIQNYAVQKIWVKEGFSLCNSFDTYHINSFLNQPFEESSRRHIFRA